MPRTQALQTSRLLMRAARPLNRTCSRIICRSAVSNPNPATAPARLRCNTFSTCSARFKAPTPDTITPSKASPTETTNTVVELDIDEYHRIADIWLDNALAKFEDLQDQGEEIDVEFSSGVMTIGVTGKGTYVLNKQPPNKQIWLSSPISGPKRYDWCVSGDGQTGSWVYARDNSTLDQLILEELEVDLEASGEL
ncbi:unnamed protein product [Clonostachys solani]|uniref:ferroxidase n=1 Tax=Clonostachys solani TaxID=160281 RepID=A0A9N9W2V7_9HYPO|nr:unnamed protein product [Clonostachys solani]